LEAIDIITDNASRKRYFAENKEALSAGLKIKNIIKVNIAIKGKLNPRYCFLLAFFIDKMNLSSVNDADCSIEAINGNIRLIINLMRLLIY
jgi:hypothetical protein